MAVISRKYCENLISKTGIIILLPTIFMISSNLTAEIIPISTPEKQDTPFITETDFGALEIINQVETTDIIQNKAFANLIIDSNMAYIKAGFTHPDDLDEEVMIEWSLYVWNAGEEKIPVLPSPYFKRQIGFNSVELNTQEEIDGFTNYDYYLLVCKNKLFQDGNWQYLFSTESMFSKIPPMNGIWERTGEVTSSSAVLHTYLTEHAPYNATDDDTLRVPPMGGLASFSIYRDQDLLNKVTQSGFFPVDDYVFYDDVGWRRANYNFRWTVTGLDPDTQYFYILETKASDGSGLREAGNINSFRTAPEISEEKSIAFVVTHCLDPNNTAYEDPAESAERGLKVFNSMLVYEDTPPDFVIMQGDTVYYDGGDLYSPDVGLYPNTEYLKRWYYWYAIYQFENLMHFFQQVPGYWMVDDHDYWGNNINQVMPDGWHVFRNVNPTPGDYGSIGENAANYYNNDYGTSAGDGAKYWRSIRWGKYLELFIEEGRNLRDEEASLIWGDEQREWLEQQIKHSDATFKIISTSTPMLGPVIPDDTYPSVVPDKHASDKFRPETELFLNDISDIENVFIIAGDRHYKYHSTINGDKYPNLQQFNEFSSGSAAAPPHAIQGGVPDSDFAKLIFSDGMSEIGASAGYLRVEINPLVLGEQITFTLISVTEDFDNQIVYQKSFINEPAFNIFIPFIIKGCQ